MKLSTILLSLFYFFAIANDFYLFRYRPVLHNTFFIFTLIFLIVCSWYLFNTYKVRKILQFTKANKYFLIYFGSLIFLQLIFHSLSISRYARLFAYVVVAVFAYIILPYILYVRRGLLITFLKIVSVYSAILASTAILSNIGYQTFLGLPFSDKYYYSFLGLHATGGILSHPLVLGAQLAIGAGCSYYLMKRNSSIFFLTLLSLCVVGVFLTMARGAYLALTVASIFYFVPKKLFNKRILTFVIVPIIGVFLLQFLYHLAKNSMLLGTILRIESGMSQREILWAYALHLISMNPIVGYGYWQSPILLEEAGLLSLGALQKGAPFHNTFIDSAVDSGIIVTFFYLLLFLVPLNRVIKSGLDYQLKRILFSLSIVMFITPLFVNHNIGGLKSVSVTMAIILGVTNWSILEKKPLKKYLNVNATNTLGKSYT